MHSREKKIVDPSLYCSSACGISHWDTCLYYKGIDIGTQPLYLSPRSLKSSQGEIKVADKDHPAEFLVTK